MKHLLLLVLFLGLMAAGPPSLNVSAAAQSASFRSVPTASPRAGSTYTLRTRYSLPRSGRLKIQLFDRDWNAVAGASVSVPSGTRNKNLRVTLPLSTPLGSGHRWMVQVHDNAGGNKAEAFRTGVTVKAPIPRVSFETPPPASVAAGRTYTIRAKWSYPGRGTLKAQLFDRDWKVVASRSATLSAGYGVKELRVTVPGNAASGDGHLWMVQVHNSRGTNKKEAFVYGVTLGGAAPPPSGGQFLPGGGNRWELEWSDDFKGTGEPTGWYAHMGSGWTSYRDKVEKGIRWTSNVEDSAWMWVTKYSEKLPDGRGTYWLDGSSQGNLILRAAIDKSDAVNNSRFDSRGPKVKCAYLQTGRPVQANASNDYPRPIYRTESGGQYQVDPYEGRFVEPGSTGVYLSCRAQTNQIQGWSTWFAFWAHSRTQAYSNKTDEALNNPNRSVFNYRTGTEIDIMEIWGTKRAGSKHAFNIANHWRQSGGSWDERYDFGSGNPEPPQALRVQDDNWHEYGVHWTRDRLVYYVDGVEVGRTREKVPSDPRDMMLFLTLEFQLDTWDGSPYTGDGRTTDDPSGFVEDNEQMRELSRVKVDWVRVHRGK